MGHGSRKIADAFWRSWKTNEGVESLGSLNTWIAERNAATHVEMRRVMLNECTPWVYDEAAGQIRNGAYSFFSIAGLRKVGYDMEGRTQAITEQPIIVQSEIGYLGIICREFDGVMHFLMQAKTEPGNVNKVQISPTLQATRSNFMLAHGGNPPAYLDYFTNTKAHNVIVDQIQSEQSSRFLGKRNRNVIVLADHPIDAPKTHRWMTLGQIKKLMRENNIVNMDSRTVLSCIPWSSWGEPSKRVAQGCDEALYNSIFAEPDMRSLNQAYGMLNNYRMHDWTRNEIVKLDELTDWDMLPDGIRHRESWPFEVIYCDIAIDGREVKRWRQPLFKARGAATFGLLSCLRGGRRKFLVQMKPEIGCFDRVEFGPTVQREADAVSGLTDVDAAFEALLSQNVEVQADVMLSEEGGRFYHEQNRNVVLFLDDCPAELEPSQLPEGYLWLDYRTLASMLSSNNNLNIQLRNLLSLLSA